MPVFGNPRPENVNFSEVLTQRFAAHFGVIWVQTQDMERFYRKVREAAIEGDYTLYKWNNVEGLLEMGLSMDTVLPVGDPVHDPTQVMTEVLRRTDELTREIFILEGLQDFVEHTEVKILLQKLAIDLPRSRRPSHILCVSPEINLNPDIARYVDVQVMDSADDIELGELLLEVQRKLEIELDRNDADRMVEAAHGLTLLEARHIFRLALQSSEDADKIVATINHERDRIWHKIQQLK